MNVVQPRRQSDTGRRAAMGLRVSSALLTTLVWLAGVACIFPALWTAFASLRPDQSFLASPFHVDLREFTLYNYGVVFDADTLPAGFKNSAIQVALILGSTLFFCPLAGYGFAKFTFRGKRFFFGLVLATLFFVPVITYIPLFIEMNNIGWVDTYQGLIVPAAIAPFGIFWMSGVVAAIPDELVQAARVDGCGHLGVWWRIVMPVIKPSLVSLAIVTFLGAYNDYFWPLIILRSPSMQTIQVILAMLQVNPKLPAVTATSNWGPLLAGSTIVMLPTIIIFLAMQRYFLSGVLQGSIKG